MNARNLIIGGFAKIIASDPHLPARGKATVGHLPAEGEMNPAVKMFAEKKGHYLAYAARAQSLRQHPVDEPAKRSDHFLAMRPGISALSGRYKPPWLPLRWHSGRGELWCITFDARAARGRTGAWPGGADVQHLR